MIARSQNSGAKISKDGTGSLYSLLLYLAAKYRNRMPPMRCLICGTKAGCAHTAGTRLKENSMLTLNPGDAMGDELGAEIIHPQRILDISANGVARMIDPEKLVPMSRSLPAGDLPPIAGTQHFETCSFCGGHILDKLLNKHLLAHLNGDQILLNLTDFRKPTEKLGDYSRVRVATNEHNSRSEEPKFPARVPTAQELKEFFRVNEIPDPKLKTVERFQFRQIHDVSWTSATSTSGRYSDFCLLVWLKESTNFHSTHYTGGSSINSYQSRERLMIHLIYDRVEHYYAISNRIFKRNSYSNYENDESLAPDRICEQHELLTEIRRIFLYYSIPPRAVLKRLVKNMKQDAVLQAEEDTGIVHFCHSPNYFTLFENLKELSQNSSTSNNNSQAQFYNGHAHPSYCMD